MLEIGQIVNTHGLRGEVKVVPWTDYPEDFEYIKNVTLKLRNEEKKLTIKKVKYQKNNIILTFAEVSKIEEAEFLKTGVLLTSRNELPELDEGVYYVADLIGIDVVEDTGAYVGKIKDVIKTGSNDVYIVARESKRDLLLPVIDDVVLNVDIDGKVATVHIMEGLDDEV